MRVTLEGPEGDIMADEERVTHSAVAEMIRDAINHVQENHIAAIGAKDAQIEEMAAKIKALEQGQSQAPNNRVVSMLDLPKIVKTLTPLQKGKFNDFATNNTKMMRLWEKDTILSEEIKITALVQVLEPEERRQWEERSPLFLEASTEGAPAWELLLEAMKQYYGQTDQEITAVLRIKNLKQGGKTVQSLLEEFKAIYHDIPTDPEAHKKIDFLVCLNPELRRMVQATSEVAKMTLEQVVTQAIRLEHRQGGQQQNQQQQPRSQQQQQRSQPNQQKGATSSGNNTNKPSGKQYSYTETDKQLLAGKLAKVNGYAPANVAELHAPTDSSNPDAEKLNAFLQHHKLCFRCREPGHMKAQCPQK